MRQLVWHFHPITNHLTTTTNISSLPMTPEFRAKSLTCHLVQSTLGPIILSVVKKLPNCPWAHLLLLFSQLWIFSFFFQFLFCLYAPFPPSNFPPKHTMEMCFLFMVIIVPQFSVSAFQLKVTIEYPSVA